MLYIIIKTQTFNVWYIITGVMQDYFEQNTFGESARVDLSFVSTLMLIATTSGSLFSRIFEIVLGMRFAFLLGSLLYTCGLVAAGSATEVCVFLL